MKTQLNEIKRMQQLAGLIQESNGIWPHNAEEVVDAAFSDDIYYISFGDSENETDYLEFDIEFDMKKYWTGSDPSGYAEYEADIVNVQQVAPIQKSWDRNEFEAYMKHLGLYDGMMKEKTDEYYNN